MKKVILLILVWTASSGLVNAQVGENENFKGGKQKYAEKMRQSGRLENKKNVTISTNLFDWANFGAINIEAGYAVSRYLTVHADLKYNPWEFKSKNPDVSSVHNQQKSAAIGLRYWPWYVFSGWWICGKVQYTDYSITGIWRPALDTGKALGAGLSAGYTFMLTRSLNLEVGAGFWGGRMLEHTLYRNPGGAIREQGPKNFIALNDIKLSIQWLF